MTQGRSRSEICLDVLRTCLAPQRPTWVIHKANLNTASFKEIALFLETRGLLGRRLIDDDDRKTFDPFHNVAAYVYLTTRRGEQLLNDLDRAFSDAGLRVPSAILV